MIENQIIPETKKSLDNIKSRYLSSHIQYGSLVSNIEGDVDFEFRSLRENFQTCVDISLPYLSTLKNSAGETVVSMTTLDNPSDEIQNDCSEVSIESIKKQFGKKTFFLPKRLGYLEVFNKNNSQENAFSSYTPIFEESNDKDHKLLYPKIKYGRIYPKSSSNTSFRGIHSFLEEMYYSYLSNPKMPESILANYMLVNKCVSNYQDKLKEQKTAYGKTMDVKLREFFSTASEYRRGSRSSFRTLSLDKDALYFIDSTSDPKIPVIKKSDGFKYKVFPKWKPTDYSEVFDMALPAEDIIIQNTLCEADQSEVFDYLRSKLRTFYKPTECTNQ